MRIWTLWSCIVDQSILGNRQKYFLAVSGYGGRSAIPLHDFKNPRF
jgi:hypothetical protein